MQKLPGDYIAGFVDGEGCFALKFRRDVRYERKGAPVYFSWDIEFAIELRNDDKDILENIQECLNCGLTMLAKRGTARYAVNDINDLLEKVVPFFEKYPLRAKKKHDFMLWKEAVKIFKRNQRSKLNRRPGEKSFHRTLWDKRDLKRLVQIHTEMKKYKSKGKEWKWIKMGYS